MKTSEPKNGDKVDILFDGNVLSNIYNVNFHSTNEGRTWISYAGVETPDIQDRVITESHIIRVHTADVDKFLNALPVGADEDDIAFARKMFNSGMYVLREDV